MEHGPLQLDWVVRISGQLHHGRAKRWNGGEIPKDRAATKHNKLNVQTARFSTRD